LVVIQRDAGASEPIGEIFGTMEVKFPHPCFLRPYVSAVTCRAAIGKKAFTPGIERTVIS